jgi:hypothetical protein
MLTAFCILVRSPKRAYAFSNEMHQFYRVDTSLAQETSCELLTKNA